MFKEIYKPFSLNPFLVRVCPETKEFVPDMIEKVRS